MARCKDVGPLAGVTLAVKDLIDVTGYVTTGGTERRGPAERDAECVARLRTAGAVVVGMANLTSTIPAATAAADPPLDPPGNACSRRVEYTPAVRVDAQRPVGQRVQSTIWRRRRALPSRKARRRSAGRAVSS